MKQAYLKFPNNEWGVVVCFDFDTDYEHDIMVEQMRSFGMSTRNAEKAIRILSNYNTGMAVSNETLKMSAIYISDATSSSEFYSTAIHEFIHVADAILDWYGESWHGEPSAYLVGFLTKEFVELVGEPCR